MGDSGSQLLGFALASLGLAASWTAAGTTVATVMLPLIVLAIPILDTTLVTVAAASLERPPGDARAARTTPPTGSSTTASRSRRRWCSSRPSRIALGATGLAYDVLDNGRITPIGVLVSVVLLVQFGNFLTELRERSDDGQARGRRSSARCSQPQG